jgi:hypothetical protein
MSTAIEKPNHSISQTLWIVTKLGTTPARKMGGKNAHLRRVVLLSSFDRCTIYEAAVGPKLVPAGAMVMSLTSVNCCVAQAPTSDHVSQPVYEPLDFCPRIMNILSRTDNFGRG